MSVTAGALSQVSVASTTADLLSAAATAGTGPYTYQWYQSTTSGFSAGVGNIVSGATSLSQSFSGLIPNTQYYYKVIATDTGAGSATSTSSQLAVATSAPVLSQNQFALVPYLGVLDQMYNYNTKSAQVGSAQATSLYAGAAVKIVDSAGGAPKVVACAAITDQVWGFINYNIKTIAFAANVPVEISQAGNVMWLYATAAIARGVEVCLDLSTNGGVQTASSHSGATIVGVSYDKASAAGDLIRVMLTVPSFKAQA